MTQDLQQDRTPEGHAVPTVDGARYLGVLRKWWWLLAVAVLLACLASFLATRSMPVVYQTSAVLRVGDDITSPNVTMDQITASQRLADGYAAEVSSQSILAAAVTALKLPVAWWELQSHVLGVHASGSQLIEVRATDADPRRAKAIADEIGRQLILQSPTSERIQQLQQNEQFVKQQLDDLQSEIQQAQSDIAARQGDLARATSARAVLDLQDQINALNTKLDGWRSTYTSLLASYGVNKGSNTLAVVNQAFVPSQPAGANVMANLATAALIGLLLAAAAVLLIEYLDDTLGSEIDVRHVLALPVLGHTDGCDKRDELGHVLVVSMAPLSPAADAYRALRANLRFAAGDRDSVGLLVTSPTGQETRSLVSANLAVSMAQAGLDTVLVDADLRSPVIHSIFGVGNSAGLSSLFYDEPIEVGDMLQQGETTLLLPKVVRPGSGLKRPVETSLVPTKVPGLRILPAGPVPANPTEVIGSSMMEDILATLAKLARVVILNCPPMDPVPDAAVVATMGVSVLLVVKQGMTRTGPARRALEILRRSHSRVLGVVLSGAHRNRLADRAGRFKVAVVRAFASRANSVRQRRMV